MSFRFRFWMHADTWAHRLDEKGWLPKSIVHWICDKYDDVIMPGWRQDMGN